MLDIEQFETKIGKKSRLLGLDPGKKRIGIAICDENKIVATPYTTIIKNKFSDLLDELNKIINEKTEKLNSIVDRKSTRLNSSHVRTSRMPSSA